MQGMTTSFLVHPTFRVMRQSCSAYSLNSKYRSSLNPYAVLFTVCRYRSCHLHQLRHFALPGLLYPIRHDPFGIVLIDLHPDFLELFFQVVCLRQGLVHIQRVVKPCLILLVEDIRPTPCVC